MVKVKEQAASVRQGLAEEGSRLREYIDHGCLDTGLWDSGRR